MAETKGVVKIDDPKQLEINNWKGFVENWRKLSIKAIPYGFVLFVFALFFPFKYAVIMIFLSVLPIVSWYASHSFKETKAWERLLVFRKGTIPDVTHVREPGWAWTKWPSERTLFVKMYERRIDVPPQKIVIESGLEGSSKHKLNKISITVDPIFYFKIKSDNQSVIDSVSKIEDAHGALKDLFIFTLRQTCAKFTPDVLIGNQKDEINESIKTAVQKEVEDWGIQVTKAGIQDVQLPKEYEEAMNAVPAADRRYEAKIIDANAEARRVEIVYRTTKKEDSDLTLRSMEAMERFAEGKGSPIIFGGLKQFLREILGKEDKK